MRKNSKKLLVLLMILPLAFLGCEEILFEAELQEENVIAITPGADIEIRKTTVDFAWEELLEATSYQLQIATPDFANAQQLVVDSILIDTEFQKVLEAGSYEWRVRAVSGSSKSPYTTTNFKIIEVQDFTARNVSLISPEINEMTNQKAQTLRWAAVTDATLYTIQLIHQNGEVIVAETTADTSMSIVFPEGIVVWQVRAEKGEEKTVFSPRTLTVDLQKPNMPEPTTPVDKSNSTDKSVRFTWTRAALVGATEFDSLYVYKDELLENLETKQRVTSPTEITLTAATYYWHVKGFDEAGNEGDASEVFSFVIN